eukprot:Rmarinus@m.17043
MPRPTWRTCYICGQQFGSASLQIHEPQCLKKFESEQQQLPPKLRRPLPSKPEAQPGKSLSNDEAFAAYNANLSPCPNCGRTFRPDRLLVHMRSCKPVCKPTERKALTGSQKLPSVSRSVASSGHCYVCGAKFGASSLKVHEKQCLVKWESEQMQLPKELRQPRPRPPSEWSQAGRGSADELSTNATFPPNQFGADKVPYVDCEGCGRSFKESAFESHEKSCLRPLVRKRSLGSSDNSAPPPKENGGKPVAPKGPRFYACYICGREFGKTSIRIHEPQCLSKWEAQQQQLSPRMRKSLPKRPSFSQGMSQEEYNSLCRRSAEDSSLVCCEHCGRTFLPDSLVVHQRSCKPKGPIAAESQKKAATGPPDIRGPRFFACYICGREFGSASLSIHEPQCMKKWEAEQKRLPASQRRPRPQRPSTTDLSAGASGREKYNDLCRTSAEQSSLVPCANCGRTFLPTSLPKHQRGCKSTRPMSKQPSGGALESPTREASTSKRESRQEAPRRGTVGLAAEDCGLVPCEHCGRTFRPDALKVHFRSCRAGKAGPPTVAHRTTLSGSQREKAATRRSSADTSSTSQNNAPHDSRTQHQALSPKNDSPTLSLSPVGKHANETNQSRLLGTTGLASSLQDPGYADEVSGFHAAEAYAEVDQIQNTCESCGRSFNASAYHRHIKICKKVFQSKRRPFDPSKQRMAGTEMEAIAGHRQPSRRASDVTVSRAIAAAVSKVTSKQKNAGKWKKQHEEFQSMIRRNRMISKAEAAGVDIRTLNLPSAPSEDDRVPCPHCTRRFNATVAERHIPKCKNIVNKPAPVGGARRTSTTGTQRGSVRKR